MSPISLLKSLKNFQSYNTISILLIFQKKNWMRISLKSNWKSKITDKIKVYSLNVKNKTFVNKTFNELHTVNKMFWIIKSTFFLFDILRLKIKRRRQRFAKKSIDHKHQKFERYYLIKRVFVIVAKRNYCCCTKLLLHLCYWLLRFLSMTYSFFKST